MIALNASRLCTVVLPWDKYEYIRLPVEICNCPDIFEAKLSELMAGLEFARVFLDKLILDTKGNYDKHSNQLKKVLTRLLEAGLKINDLKSSTCKQKFEF